MPKQTAAIHIKILNEQNHVSTEPFNHPDDYQPTEADVKAFADRLGVAHEDIMRSRNGSLTLVGVLGRLLGEAGPKDRPFASVQALTGNHHQTGAPFDVVFVRFGTD